MAKKKFYTHNIISPCYSKSLQSRNREVNIVNECDETRLIKCIKVQANIEQHCNIHAIDLMVLVLQDIMAATLIIFWKDQEVTTLWKNATFVIPKM